MEECSHKTANTRSKSTIQYNVCSEINVNQILLSSTQQIIHYVQMVLYCMQSFHVHVNTVCKEPRGHRNGTT